MITSVDWITIIISVFAVIISLTAMYLGNFYKGKLIMIMPSQIWFGYDTPKQDKPAVFLKTMLFSTGKRGIVVERMFVRLLRGETSQSFNIWTVGTGSNMYRPGGLRITENGFVADHVFLLPKDGADFRFIAGEYEVQVFAKLAHTETTQMMSSVVVSVSQEQANSLNGNMGIFFDLNSDADKYVVSMDPIPLDRDAKMVMSVESMVSTLKDLSEGKES